MGYLISETTKEEREQIVKDSLGNMRGATSQVPSSLEHLATAAVSEHLCELEANCDGCMAGLAEMYQDYIDGKKELREINMEFNARYVKSEEAR